jgi:hypothetical protein
MSAILCSRIDALTGRKALHHFSELLGLYLFWNEGRIEARLYDYVLMSLLILKTGRFDVLNTE